LHNHQYSVALKEVELYSSGNKGRGIKDFFCYLNFISLLRFELGMFEIFYSLLNIWELLKGAA